MGYVVFDWVPPKHLRPMFACQEDWDALQAIADAWWDRLLEGSREMAEKPHPLAKWLKRQNASKCESIERK